MKCKVVLHSILRDRLPPEARGVTILELKEYSTIADVIDLLKLPQGCICLLRDHVVQDINQCLVDGDELHFLRPAAGG